MGRNDCTATNEAGHRCVFGQGHGGDHNFGLAGVRDVPAPEIKRCDALHPYNGHQCELAAGHEGYHRTAERNEWNIPAIPAPQTMETYSVTIGDRDFPKWQETIRRAQRSAQIVAENKAAAEAAAKTEAQRIESEHVANLLEMLGLPRGEQVVDCRRVGDYVIGLSRKLDLLVRIEPIDADPDIMKNIWDCEWSDSLWQTVWAPVTRSDGGGYTISAQSLPDVQVKIADAFDELERKYATETERAKRRMERDQTAQDAPEPTEPERLYELLRGLVDRALDDRGVGI